jgi:RNA polymerase sigma factor (sigma-70 family)
MDGVCLEFAGKVSGQPSPMSEVDELSLIRRAQAGDRSAFDALVRLYDQNVLRLALQVVGSPEEARDLYQEAFLKVYRSIGQFRAEAKFSTWLHRVVMNVCLDHLRRQRTRKEVAAPQPEEGEPEFLQTVPDERPTLAHGLRVKALPGAETAGDRGDMQNQRADGEKLPVPRHAETAGGVG